jgi:hypothetical protein
MGGVPGVGMTIGAVERLVESVGRIMDLETLLHAIGRQPDIESVAEEAPLLVGGFRDTSHQDPEEQDEKPEKTPQEKMPRTSAPIRHRTAHRR